MSLPFEQKRRGSLLIREFSKDVDANELVWHRDRADRHVTVKAGTSWQLQLENKLPEKLVVGKTYFIPANTYHRVLKGQETLIIEIRETKKMKITKRQLRGIIREVMETGSSYPAIEEFDRLRKEGDLALRSWLGFMSRQPLSILGDLARLWSGMVAKPGDVKAARELASALGVSPASASFHARKMRSGTEYPTGAELERLVVSYREELEKKRAANPPKPRPRKPYGGGTRNRPWDQST